MAKQKKQKNSDIFPLYKFKTYMQSSAVTCVCKLFSSYIMPFKVLKVFLLKVCLILIHKLLIAFTQLTFDYSLHRYLFKLFILSDNAMWNLFLGG